MATHSDPTPDPPRPQPPGRGAFWPVAGLIVLVITAILAWGLLFAPGCGRTNPSERAPGGADTRP